MVSAALGEDQESGSSSIQIRSVRNLAQRSSVIPEEIRNFEPDYVLVSSEDLSHILLRAVGRAAPQRIVYLAHTPQFFPFGPESWNPDPQPAAIVRGARAIVSIGHHMAGYIRQHLGAESVVVHPPIYGAPPFARLAHFEAGSVLMINPCQVKGVGIFVELAQRFPQISFAALSGWGTTTADKAALAAVPNVRLLASVPQIDEVLAQTRVLLMPSLWYEGFGLIVMEAMLRAIPVIASDSGGLVEAKEGTGFVVPVRGVERYLPEFDEVHMPKPVIPEQDIEPWAVALKSLLGERDLYEDESERSRVAAERFVSGVDPARFEQVLTSLERPVPAKSAARSLTPAQRDLLMRRLRERGKA